MAIPPPQPPAASPPPPQPPAYSPPPAQTPYGGPPPGSGMVIPYASSGARLIAYIVDGIILGFVESLFYVLGFIVLAGGATADSGAGIGIGFLVIVIGIVLGVLWKPWFWSHGGQTPAYKILGMRLVRARDGGPVSLGTALLRLIGYIISAMVFYLGFIWILFDARRQGWHDKIADTVVIQA